MEYETYAAIRLYLAGRSLNVALISQLLEKEPESWLRKGEKRQRGDGSPYAEHRCEYRIREARSMKIGEELKNLRADLEKIEQELRGLTNEGGDGWLIIEIYDSDFIGINLDQQSLQLLTCLNLGLAIENRCSP